MKKGIALLLALAMCLAAVPALAGWEVSGGRYWYSYEDGSWAANRWIQDGAWYYMDGDGWMVTGWRQIGGNWYYFDASGAMKTGWLQQGDNWYYLTDSGVLATSGTYVIGGAEYTFDANGIWQEQAASSNQTGWVEKDGAWYYYDESGNVSTAWNKIDGNWYYFTDSGAMATGWNRIDGAWYYFEASGVMKTGWLEQGDDWYYLNEGGTMVTGTAVIGGIEYRFNASGLWQPVTRTGWVEADGGWTYILDDGSKATGWKEIKSTWYFFGENGLMQTGWLQQGEDWYYLAASGAMMTGWMKIDGDKYYFLENGSMVTGELVINGKTYHFDENGINRDPMEIISLTVFIGDPGDVPDENNKIYKMIEEEFGVKFEFEYLRGNLDETIGLKIANKDIPDLFYAGNSADLAISGGAMINLLDYVSPEKTPRLWAHIESQRDRLIEKDVDGNDVLYIIPNYGLADGDQIVNTVNGPAFFIQKQVLAWAGYPQIKTLNEYFDLIEKFIDANPTDTDGTPYTGFTILCEDWRRFCLINPVQHLMGRPNDGEVYICVTDQNYEVTGNDPSVPYKTETFIDKPYAKAYYKKLNEEFQRGLIDQSTFTDSYDAYIAKLASGTVLGMFDQTWDFGSATQALIDAKMYENTYVALGLVYDPEYVNGAEIEEHYVNGSLPNVRRGFGISVNCEDPERIISMWEEMMSDEWQVILNWGIEGEDYYITEDGRLMMTEEQYANQSNSAWKLENKADGIFTNSPKKQGYIMNDIQINDKTIVAGNCWEPDNQPEIVYEKMNNYDKDFLEHYGYKKFADFVNSPIELAPYGEAWQINYDPVDTEHTKFLKVQDSELPQLILSKPEEFDNKWDKFVADIKDVASVFAQYMQEQVLKLATK